MRESQSDRGGIATAVVLQASWGSQSFKFAAQFKPRSTPPLFQEALRRARQSTEKLSCYPMIVLPYLRPQQLDELQQMQTSGLDLSGNGVVIIPEKLFVLRTGSPNMFPESTPTKYAYRGTTSLVARVFLCRTTYESLSDVVDETQNRGANVAISTVSKALKRMEEDLVVERRDGEIRLVQADKLLQKLAENYQRQRFDAR